MTITRKTMQLVLAMAMIAAPAANAKHWKRAKTKVKEDTLVTLSGVAMQVANVSMGPQVKDDLFAGAEKFAQGASEVSEINLDPKTMGMIGHGKDGGLAGKMNFMVVHSYKYDKPGMYSMDDFLAYTKKLTDGSWNCYIHVRQKDGSTDICSRTASDNETNEMVILTAQPRALTFIHMSGRMSLGDLNRMSESPGNIHLPRDRSDPPEPKAPKSLPSPTPSPTPPSSPR